MVTYRTLHNAHPLPNISGFSNVSDSVSSRRWCKIVTVSIQIILTMTETGSSMSPATWLTVSEVQFRWTSFWVAFLGCVWSTPQMTHNKNHPTKLLFTSKTARSDSFRLCGDDPRPVWPGRPAVPVQRLLQRTRLRGCSLRLLLAITYVWEYCYESLWIWIKYKEKKSGWTTWEASKNIRKSSPR